MPRWNQLTEKLVWEATAGIRKRRNEVFLRCMNPLPTDKVLDLGSEDGSQIATFYPYLERVYLADILERPMQRGVKRYGFAGYSVIERNGTLSFEDQSFDIVYCNSVIEHVTDQKFENQWDFLQKAHQHQRRFASEVMRVGRGYFVQTPNRHFPIESHALLPFVGYLPARQNMSLARILKKYWIKKWFGEFHLLTRKDMKDYFPDATIIPERFCGFVKSWIAYRPPPDAAARLS
ncbi:MAG: methyltransferase domain-containing protein [Planctomycetes bacterium]|nr:methyltransferase domain-containing protein [Planctomycetota bacterium]